MVVARRAASVLIWGAVLIAVTLVLRASRGDIDQAHVVLVYLLAVLGGSVSGGRILGLPIACPAFALIDFFFQLPYDRLTVRKALERATLVSLLLTAVVATRLLELV